MIRVGIIGCGAIATRHHAPALARIPDVKIEAVCDLDADRARQLSATYGAACFTSVDAFFGGTDLDVVDVVTRENVRPPLLLRALQEGKHVFTEKPLAGADGQYRIQPSDLPALYPILDEWKRRGTKFGINFNLRQSANVIQFKNAVDSGELGEPVMLNVDTYLGSSNHIVDLLRWVNGDIVEVSAVARGRYAESTKCAHLAFENGTIGTFAVTPDVDVFFTLQYVGTKQRGVVRDICGDFTHWSRDGSTGQIWKPTRLGDQTYTRLFALSIERFIDSVRGNGEPAADALDGLRSAEVEAAITQSIDSGKRVTVERHVL
jgi:predicted dehydrogenase